MTVRSESSKCLKASEGPSNGIDRISNLPNHLVSHILSLLPIKDAVATSILSTRWKFLWTFVTHLEFELKCCGNVGMRNKLQMTREFTLFVNRVLHLLNAPIQEFCLDLNLSCSIDLFYLDYWISIGFGPIVRKFSLVYVYDEAYKLHLGQIFCNIADLKLSGDIHINIPASASLCFPSVQSLSLDEVTPIIAKSSSISFPNLKTMNLSCVLFPNEDSIQKFLSSSPVLDDLIINRSSLDDIECLIIHIPSLTRLSISFWGSEQHDRVHKIKIDSRALQYLKLVDCMPCEYLPGESLSFLLEACVIIELDDENNVDDYISIFNFLRRLSNVKFLSISGILLKTFTLPHIKLGFQNLMRLEIMWFDCPDLCTMINSFPEGMDNLEHLIFKGRICPKYLCSHQSYWSDPLNVPKCLLSQVTTVSISSMIVDCCDQVEFLKYILKNAEVLQVLTIDAKRFSEEKKLEFVKKLSLIPRGSRTCQVTFT